MYAQYSAWMELQSGVPGAGGGGGGGGGCADSDRLNVTFGFVHGATFEPLLSTTYMFHSECTVAWARCSSSVDTHRHSHALSCDEAVEL